MAVPGVFVAPGGLGVSVVIGAACAMVAALATSATCATILESRSCHWCDATVGVMSAAVFSGAALFLGAAAVSVAL